MTVQNQETSLKTGKDGSPPRSGGRAHIHPYRLLMNPWSEEEEAAIGRKQNNKKNNCTFFTTRPSLPD